METKQEKKEINPQPFYEISNNLSTMKSLLIFLDLGVSDEIMIKNSDLSNITTLLKTIVNNTIENFEKIEKELKI